MIEHSPLQTVKSLHLGVLSRQAGQEGETHKRRRLFGLLQDLPNETDNGACNWCPIWVQR